MAKASPERKKAVLLKVIALLRAEGVKMDSPYDFENFFEVSHSELFATGGFKMEDDDE